MKHSKLTWTLTLVALACVLTLGACKKKVAPPPPPPPPPPAAPTATLTANPATVERGQATQLTWQTENATDVSIDGVGAVQPNGSQSVTPSQSTTYHLTAKGAGGTREATARVTVTQPPPPPPPPPAAPTETLEQSFAKNVLDIYFDYDKYDIRGDAQPTLQTSAAWLKAHAEVKVTVEGHCDERGSTEYNLALGDNRARAAKQALAGMGVSADQLNPISYGKERPQCTESTEQCWQMNRRAHFTMAGGGR